MKYKKYESSRNFYRCLNNKRDRVISKTILDDFKKASENGEAHKFEITTTNNEDITLKIISKFLFKATEGKVLNRVALAQIIKDGGIIGILKDRYGDDIEAFNDDSNITHNNMISSQKNSIFIVPKVVDENKI